MEKNDNEESRWQDKLSGNLDVETKDSQEEGLFDPVAGTTIYQPLILKNIERTKMVEGIAGKIYFDPSGKKVKIFINKESGWADLLYTTTSTSTSSSTSTSTSTTTTSTSTTTTSSSTTTT